MMNILSCFGLAIRMTRLQAYQIQKRSLIDRAMSGQSPVMGTLATPNTPNSLGLAIRQNKSREFPEKRMFSTGPAM
jgi:hypothetical protein